MRKFFVATCLAGLLLPGVAQGSAFTLTPLVPPADGEYRTPQDVHADYSGEGLLVVLRDIRHHAFTGGTFVDGPTFTVESFDSVVNGMVSINGSPFSPISLTGPFDVLLTGGYSPGDLGTYQTEMLSMNLMGGGVQVRESPTLQSLGQTTITDLGAGGPYQIDSFFDIFTELSIDGGQTWIPSNNGPAHVDLFNEAQVPEPASLLLLGSGLVGVALGLRRRTASPRSR